MDSGDHSNNQLKASDSGFGGGFRSQSFSNLFQGFFGVKPTSTSTAGVTSSDFEEKLSEGRSLETIVSPSYDDSWILSHFLQAKREKEYGSNLRRNITWSELGKLDHLRSSDLETASSASSTPDVRQNEHLPVPGVHVLESDSGYEPRERSEEPAKPKIIVAKHVEHPDYPRNILSSFLSHDLPHREVRQKEECGELKHPQEQINTRLTQASASVTGEVARLGDKLDGGNLPGAMISGDKIPESKQTLKDFLWSFNHEKINVSRKEMNLIASIDQ